MNSAVELRLHLLKRDSKRKVSVRIIIGAPEPAGVPHSEGGTDWCCSVHLKGISKKEGQVFGVDSWQAMTLAFRYVEVNLRQEVREVGSCSTWGNQLP